MKDLYKKIGELLIEQDFNALHDLKIEKPDYFNWVQEVYEDIHVQETPDKTALLWTDGEVTHHYT